MSAKALSIILLSIGCVLACGQGAALRSAQDAGKTVQESSGPQGGSQQTRAQNQSSAGTVKEISLAELTAMNKASAKGTASQTGATSNKVAKSLPEGAMTSGASGTATRSSSTSGAHEDPVFPWDTSAPKKVYVVDLKKFGITPGYQRKGADGHYTDRQYDLMCQNGVGFTEAIQWAYKNDPMQQVDVDDTFLIAFVQQYVEEEEKKSLIASEMRYNRMFL